MRPRTFLTGDGQVRRSKVRRQTPCGKQAYSSRKDAAAKAKAASKMTGEPIGFYHCARGCHGWHLGHPIGWHDQQAAS